MNTQSELPGMDPANERASPEDTATTTLIFDTDDKVAERVVNALIAVFFAPESATAHEPRSKRNAQGFARRLVECAKEDRQLRNEFRNYILSVVSEIADTRIAAQLKALEQAHRRARGMPKGPRK